MKKKILKAFFSADNNILQKYAHRVRHFLATIGFKAKIERYRNIRIFLSTDLSL